MAVNDVSIVGSSCEPRCNPCYVCTFLCPILAVRCVCMLAAESSWHVVVALQLVTLAVPLSSLPLLVPFLLVLHCIVLSCCTVLCSVVLCLDCCPTEVQNSAPVSLTPVPLVSLVVQGDTSLSSTELRHHEDLWKCARFHDRANRAAQRVTITNETGMWLLAGRTHGGARCAKFNTPSRMRACTSVRARKRLDYQGCRVYVTWTPTLCACQQLLSGRTYIPVTGEASANLASSCCCTSEAVHAAVHLPTTLPSLGVVASSRTSMYRSPSAFGMK